MIKDQNNNMDPRIIQYYKLSEIVRDENKMTPLINQVQKMEFDRMFTEKQKEAQLRTVDGILYFKQKVIGGSNKQKIIVI